MKSSLWKVNKIPEGKCSLSSFDSEPLGTLKEVRLKLLDVYYMLELNSVVSKDDGLTYYRFQWDNKILMILTDHSDGKVRSLILYKVDDFKHFHSLYVQLFELFGVTLYDEENCKFITPKDYKKLYC